MHGGESLVADRGCVPETSCERHHKGSEGAVLNFPNSLLIGTHFDVFMLSIASGEGLEGAWGLKTLTSKKALS